MSEIREITGPEFQEFIETPQADDEVAVVQFYLIPTWFTAMCYAWHFSIGHIRFSLNF